VTDSNREYLAKVSRDLRSDVSVRDELHVTHIAHIEIGRRAVSVHVTSSTVHGTSARITLLARAPADGGHRLRQEVHARLDQLDQVIAALTTARAKLVAAAPPSPASTKPQGT
jgi:hypothetical protein